MDFSRDYKINGLDHYKKWEFDQTRPKDSKGWFSQEGLCSGHFLELVRCGSRPVNPPWYLLPDIHPNKHVVHSGVDCFSLHRSLTL